MSDVEGEPSEVELAAIEWAEPLRRAELALLDRELVAMRRPTRRAHRKVLAARQQVAAVRARLVGELFGVAGTRPDVGWAVS